MNLSGFVCREVVEAWQFAGSNILNVNTNKARHKSVVQKVECCDIKFTQEVSELA